MRYGALSNQNIGSIEDVATITVDGFKVLWLEFLIGVANLSAFTVEFQLVGSGNWFQVAGAGADFTTPNHPVLKASGNLTTAASGATVHNCKLDVAGVGKVRIQAAGTASTLTGTWKVG